MGVETCDDCGGQVADSAETCPHCGSNANHLRRIRPLQEEEAKKLEAARKQGNKGCLIIAVVLIALVGGCLVLGASLPESCTSKWINLGMSASEAMAMCD